jgi:hypothetical protein
MRALAAVLLLASACARKAEVEYVQMKPVKDLVEIAFEAPKDWDRNIEKAGDARSSWAVTLVQPGNRLVNIDIKKYALSPKTKGFPVLSVQEMLDQVKALPKTTVGPVETATTPHLGKVNRFTFEGDWLQVSGAPGATAPAMKGVDVFFEKGGFLYVVDYAVPADEFDKNRPVFEHVLETLEVSPA